MALDPFFCYLGPHHPLSPWTVAITASNTYPGAGYSKEYLRTADFNYAWRAPLSTSDEWFVYDYATSATRPTGDPVYYFLAYEARGNKQTLAKIQTNTNDDTTWTDAVDMKSITMEEQQPGGDLRIAYGTLSNPASKRYWRVLFPGASRGGGNVTPVIYYFGLHSAGNYWRYVDYPGQPIEPGRLALISGTAQDETAGGVIVTNRYFTHQIEFEVRMSAADEARYNSIRNWAEAVHIEPIPVAFHGAYPLGKLDGAGSAVEVTFARRKDTTFEVHRYHTGLYDISFTMVTEPWR